MRLLDRMLRSGVRDGVLEIIDHDGTTYRYGRPDGRAPVRMRFTEPHVAGRIGRSPDLGAGEAYMDGTLVIEPPHDIRDMIELISRNAAIDGPQSRLRRAAERALGWAEQVNTRAGAARNIRHHYDLTRRFYELFLDADRHYTMAYFRDPADTGETDCGNIDEIASPDAFAVNFRRGDCRPVSLEHRASEQKCVGANIGLHRGDLRAKVCVRYQSGARRAQQRSGGGQQQGVDHTSVSLISGPSDRR